MANSEEICAFREKFPLDRDWEWMAHRCEFRLPRYTTQVTTGKMRAWLRRLGLTEDEYLRWSGFETLGEFKKTYPTWPLRAWAGTVLWHRDEIASA